MKKHKVKGIIVDYPDLENYEPSISDEISKMLSEELAKEIDKEILKGLGIKSRNVMRMDGIGF